MIQARPHFEFLWRRRVFEDGKQGTEHKIITTACIYQEIEGGGGEENILNQRQALGNTRTLIFDMYVDMELEGEK